MKKIASIIFFLFALISSGCIGSGGKKSSDHQIRKSLNNTEDSKTVLENLSLEYDKLERFESSLDIKGLIGKDRMYYSGKLKMQRKINDGGNAGFEKKVPGDQCQVQLRVTDTVFLSPVFDLNYAKGTWESKDYLNNQTWKSALDPQGTLTLLGMDIPQEAILHTLCWEPQRLFSGRRSHFDSAKSLIVYKTQTYFIAGYVVENHLTSIHFKSSSEATPGMNPDTTNEQHNAILSISFGKKHTSAVGFFFPESLNISSAAGSDYLLIKFQNPKFTLAEKTPAKP